MMSEAELLEALSTAYGFQIPSIFAEFIWWNLQLRQKPESQTIEQEDFIAFLIYGIARKVLLKTSGSGRYFHTPPELFPFGHCGIDGIHYGYVVHAPELGLSDYPIGEFDPMDDTGVTLIGNTTSEALECLLSEALEICDVDEPGKRSLMAELVQDLNLQPMPEKVREDYTVPIKPYIPAGWHFEPSGDGVGVLAPSEFWSPETPILATWSFDAKDEYGCDYQDIDRAIEEVQRAFYGKYLATALFILRETYWRSPGLDLLEIVAPWWQRAYDELNRSCLAEAVHSHLIEQRTKKTEWRMQAGEYDTSTALEGDALDGDGFAEFRISDD